MRPLTRSCFFLFLLGRLLLLVFLHLLGICLPLLWSPLFLLQAPTLISLSLSLSLATVRLSLTLTLSLLTTWYFGLTALFHFVLKKAALVYLPTAFSVATLSFSAGPVFPSFSIEAYTILQALYWSRQHQQVFHFFSSLV